MHCEPSPTLPARNAVDVRCTYSASAVGPSGARPRIYKNHIRVNAPLCFWLNGQERSSAYAEQEATEDAPVPAEAATARSRASSGRHGEGTRKAASLCQLLRVWSPSAGST